MLMYVAIVAVVLLVGVFGLAAMRLARSAEPDRTEPEPEPLPEPDAEPEPEPAPPRKSAREDMPDTVKFADVLAGPDEDDGVLVDDD